MSESPASVARRHPRSTPLTFVAAAALVMLVVHTLANAVMRSVGDPITATLEYSQYWYMPVIGCIGYYEAQRRREHIDAPLVYERVPPSLQRIYRIVGDTLAVILSAALAWYSLQEALEAFEIRRALGVNNVTVWPVMFVAPIGFALLGFEIVRGAINRNGRTPATPSIEELEQS